MREICPICHEKVEFEVDNSRPSEHARKAWVIDDKSRLWAAIVCQPDKAERIAAWWCEGTGQLAARWEWGNRAKGEYRGPAGEVETR